MNTTLRLFFIVLATRLILLVPGYGPEEDAWGHVQNIYEMKAAGHYIMSRLPGHPVYEGLLYLLFPIHSPLVYNLLSALFSSFAVVAFYKILEHFNIKSAQYGALTFALVPTFLLSSAYTIDYAVGLAFALWAYYFILKQKSVLAGVLLALAVGTRVTWVLMLIPLLASLNGYRFETFKFKKSFQFLMIFGVCSALAYYPVYDAYGPAFFNTYSLPYPPLAKAIFKGTIGVWGVLGFGAICLAFLIFLKRIKHYLGRLRWRHIIWLIPVFLYTIIYIRLPEKSAFFIPVLPFLLLFIFSLIGAKWIKRSMYIMALSVLFFGVNISDSLRGATPKKSDLRRTVSGQEIFFSVERGPLFLEMNKRQNKQDATLKFGDALRNIEKPTAVICGWWYAMIDITNKDNEWPWPENVKLHYYLSNEEMETYLENGYDLLYLPEQGEINNRKYNSTLATRKGELFEL